MSNPAITTIFGNPDPLATVQTIQELVDLLNALVTSTLQGSYVPYVIGSTTPIVGDQDKAWIRLDGSGRPKGTYVFYNGGWRKNPTGLTKEIRMFNGNPATYFDTSGLGLLSPDDWDGWAICNGNNSTTDLSNQFIVGGAMNNGATPPLVGGYSAGWTTQVTGDTLKTGGLSSTTLVNNHLPYNDIQLTGYSAGGGPNSLKQAIVTGEYNSSAQNTCQVYDLGAKPPTVQLAVPTVPPFYAMALVQWVGYA